MTTSELIYSVTWSADWLCCSVIGSATKEAIPFRCPTHGEKMMGRRRLEARETYGPVAWEIMDFTKPA